MARTIAPVLADILEALRGVEHAVADKSFDEFRDDWLLRHAVQRAVEACRHLPDEILASYPAIPWARIRASGNVLRHEYFRVADDVIWSVVVDELPALKAVILKIDGDQRSSSGG